MGRKANRTRLIISFIGNTDLKYLSPDGENRSPILRLLSGLPVLEPRVPPADTRLLLLDDAPRSGERAQFCDQLRLELPALGLPDLRLERHAVVLPEGPTDLNALYENVWAAIPSWALHGSCELVFHLTSGTPAMQFTLMLAAYCLPIDRWRLVETSRQQNLREVRPPYVLAARERRTKDQARGTLALPVKARRTLLPDTVIDDPQVHAAYAALHKAATNQRTPQRILIQGPTGSGKWHACQQFAVWRGANTEEWPRPADPDNAPDSGTLLIRHLDSWPETALEALTLLAATRPNLAIAATFRTDWPSAAPLAALTREGLRGAAHIELPALGTRSDIVALGEAVARRDGFLNGKLKSRLQYDLLTDVFPSNLHDLRRLLATANAHSVGAHLERNAYIRGKDIRDARAALDEAWRILSSMDFGPGRYRLDDVLDVIRASIVQRALADGRSQQKAGELLGLKQQTISTIYNKQLPLRHWTSLSRPDGEPSDQF